MSASGPSGPLVYTCMHSHLVGQEAKLWYYIPKLSVGVRGKDSVETVLVVSIKSRDLFMESVARHFQ